MARTPDGEPWLALATSVLEAAGCDRVLVVLGAEADRAASLAPPSAEVIVAERWAGGMSESLRAGLSAATGVAALITLVDLPGLPVEVVRRVLGADVGVDSLRQAVFDGRPGHPVLIGRAHWEPVLQTLEGDHGARGYLVANGVDEIECGDLFDGRDVDSIRG